MLRFPTTAANVANVSLLAKNANVLIAIQRSLEMQCLQIVSQRYLVPTSCSYFVDFVNQRNRCIAIVASPSLEVWGVN